MPPTSNANYGWILSIVSKLSQNGIAGFLLANGALLDSGAEYEIRKQLMMYMMYIRRFWSKQRFLKSMQRNDQTGYFD